jgi:hypothetical protein
MKNTMITYAWMNEYASHDGINVRYVYESEEVAKECLIGHLGGVTKHIMITELDRFTPQDDY